jgi:hypothetical protein
VPNSKGTMSRNETALVAVQFTKVASAHRFRTITSTPKHSLTSPSPLDMAVAIGSAITITLAPGPLSGHDHAVSDDVCRGALTPLQRERLKHKMKKVKKKEGGQQKKREQARGC